MTHKQPITCTPPVTGRAKMVTLIGVACGLFALPLSGALVAYEDFGYDISESTALAGKGSAGNGWEGSWTGNATIVEDTLSYSNGSISITGNGQALSIQGNANTLFSRQFETIGNNEGEDVYFSFLFKYEAAGTGSPNQDYLNFYLSNDADRANSGGVGVTSTAHQNLGVRAFGDSTSFEGAQIAHTGPSYQMGETYLLVGRISTNGTSGATDNTYDMVQLWVNPDSTTPGTPFITLDYSLMLDDNEGFSFFGLHSAGIGGGDDFRIDELRIGTSFAGVVVPEPGTYAALFGATALLLTVTLRRRSSRRQS